MKNKEIYDKAKQELLNVSEELRLEFYCKIKSMVKLKDEEMEEIVNYAFDFYMNDCNTTVSDVTSIIYDLIENYKMTVKEICQLSKADFIDKICFGWCLK